MYILLILSFIAILIAFFIRLPYFQAEDHFIYKYKAKTKFEMFDHSYSFSICKMNDGYRCYIERTPSMRGRDTSGYMPHYWVEEHTERHFICWTGKIKYPEQAKTLCRNWSDATQIFIDTGVPAPGFERQG